MEANLDFKIICIPVLAQSHPDDDLVNDDHLQYTALYKIKHHLMYLGSTVFFPPWHTLRNCPNIRSIS